MAQHPILRQFVYVVNELNSSVTRFVMDTASGVLSAPVTVSTLAPGYPQPDQESGGTIFLPQPQHASEIVIHPNGLVLYVANRGTFPGMTTGSRGGFCPFIHSTELR